jgi:hypothetical protein
MAQIALDGDLLKYLIARRLGGGVTELLDRWNATCAEDGDDEKGAPHRATIYRWLQGSLPRRDELLRLSGLLDVDPFCLLALPMEDEAAAIRQIHSSFWLNRWEPAALSFLAEFFGHQHFWPPAQLAKEYFGRDWHRQEFAHEPKIRANFYAQIELRGSIPSDTGVPQVFHFAYQQPGLYGQRWIQYGFVEARGRMVRLVNITGQIERYELDTNSGCSLVETWFGPSPVNFRIASLHPFSIQVRNTEEETKLRVRFSA